MRCRVRAGWHRGLGVIAVFTALLLAGVPRTYAGGTLSPAAGAAAGAAHALVKAAPAAKPDVVRIIDADHNKLFDDLEQRMAAAGDAQALPVIVMYTRTLAPADEAQLKAAVGAFHARFTYDAAFPGFAADLTKAQIQALARLPFVRSVEYDEPVYALDDTASQYFGATKARADFGVTGDRDGAPKGYSTTDIVIAVIDTGIDNTHVDLDGGKVIGWDDLVNGRTTPYDDNGHGTHVSSIAAGEGDGNAKYVGVAPGAALVGVKVLNAAGSGSMSTVAAGVNWVINNKSRYNIRVINMSLGTSACSDGTDSTSTAVNNAVAAGIVAVVAAGNSGPGTCTVGSPAAAANAITVGAMADPGEGGFYLADFSSRGPTLDGRLKPDVAAPGVSITAAKARSGNGYVTYSGTSMATPFVAGTVALMLDANPSLTPSQVKSDITSTAQGWGPAGPDVDYGFGRLQAYEAVKLAGGFTGTGPAVPVHGYSSGSLGFSGDSDLWSLSVTSTAYPVAVTLIMPNWSGGRPDFDLYVYDPSGALVGYSEGTRRQETVHFQPTKTGTYTIEVYSYSGSGSYFFDTSAGQ